MKTPSTRLLLTIPFGIPAYWTPEQALADANKRIADIIKP